MKMPFLIVVLILILLFSGNMMKVSIATIRTVKATYQNLATVNGLRFGVDSLLVLSVITVESGGKPDSTGTSGERGLMQVMKGTFTGVNAQYGIGGSWDSMYSPALNVAIGTAYLSQCLAAFPGDTRKALQAYNGGIAGVRKNPALSTMYADKVLNVYSSIQSL